MARLLTARRATAISSGTLLLCLGTAGTALAAGAPPADGSTLIPGPVASVTSLLPSAAPAPTATPAPAPVPAPSGGLGSGTVTGAVSTVTGAVTAAVPTTAPSTPATPPVSPPPAPTGAGTPTGGSNPSGPTTKHDKPTGHVPGGTVLTGHPATGTPYVTGSTPSSYDYGFVAPPASVRVPELPAAAPAPVAAGSLPALAPSQQQVLAAGAAPALAPAPKGLLGTTGSDARSLATTPRTLAVALAVMVLGGIAAGHLRIAQNRLAALGLD